MFSSADNYHHEEKEVLRKKPKSKKSKVKWICEIILGLDKDPKLGVRLIDVLFVAEVLGIDKISSQELIFKMVDQGVLYRPKNGYIKSVFENEIILY